MLYKQVFKTLEGADKRARFENAHRHDRRDNVNYRFIVVRCVNGVPDTEPFSRERVYDYRIERTTRVTRQEG
jgi:hypothetical protein